MNESFYKFPARNSANSSKENVWDDVLAVLQPQTYLRQVFIRDLHS